MGEGDKIAVKKIIILCFCLLLSSCGKDNTQTNNIIPSQEIQEEVQLIEEKKEEIQEFVMRNLDLTEFFQEVDGTAVFYTPQKTEYYFNQEKANIPVSPYSTFKIMSTLIGLYEGVVTSSDSEMSYSGRIYWNENWNQQLTLKESFQTSCVWFYHK